MSSTYQQIREIIKKPPSTVSGIESMVVDIGPQEAINLLAQNFERNRDIKQGYVSMFGSAISGKAWQEGTPIRFAREKDGSLVLVDGQHRLSAIMQSGEIHTVTIIISPCPPDREYALADTIMRKRSAATAIHALDANCDLPYTALNIYAAALHTIESNFNVWGNRMISHMQTAKMFQDYWDEIDLITKTIGKANNPSGNGIFRGSCLSVMIVTARHAPRQLWTDFWVGVKTDDGLRAFDPRKKLVNYLRDNTAGTNKERQKLIVATIRSWNAFCEGEEIKVLGTGEQVVKSIKHTPFPKQS